MNMTIIIDIQYNYNISNFVLEKDYEFMMNLASLLSYCHCLHTRLLRKTFWDFIIIIQTKDRKTARRYITTCRLSYLICLPSEVGWVCYQRQWLVILSTIQSICSQQIIKKNLSSRSFQFIFPGSSILQNILKCRLQFRRNLVNMFLDSLADGAQRNRIIGFHDKASMLFI